MKPTEKRFTDVKKWDREWYLNLTSDEKVIWQFLCDNCDRSGFWTENWTLIRMLTGIQVTEMPKPLCKQVQETNTDGVWFIKDFPPFQYGEEYASKQGYLQKKCVERMRQYGVGGSAPPTPPPVESPIDIDMDINMEFNLDIIKAVKDFCKFQAIRHPKIYKNIDKQIEDGYDIIEKLIRLDGYALNDIKDALQWGCQDEFWSSNIITLTGLRKKSKNGATKFANLYTKYGAQDNYSQVEDFING